MMVHYAHILCVCSPTNRNKSVLFQNGDQKYITIMVPKSRDFEKENSQRVGAGFFNRSVHPCIAAIIWKGFGIKCAFCSCKIEDNAIRNTASTPSNLSQIHMLPSESGELQLY